MNRKLVYKVAGVLGANSLSRAMFRDRLLVLSYHGVCGEQVNVADPDGLHVPAAIFEAQVNELVKHYRIVSLSQVRDSFLHGVSLPQSSLLITFDDGYRNVARFALPILRRMGLPSVLFPVAGAVEKGLWLWNSRLEARYANSPEFTALKTRLKGLSVAERHRWLETELPDETLDPECDYSLLSWTELARELELGSVEIGSHGLNHEPLTGCDADQLAVELSESHRLIRERLNVSPNAIAYPNGDSSSTVTAAAKTAGYALGFTTVARHSRSGDNPLAIPRILVGKRDTPSVLSARLAGWQEWLRSNSQ